MWISVISPSLSLSLSPPPLSLSLSRWNNSKPTWAKAFQLFLYAQKLQGITSIRCGIHAFNSNFVRNRLKQHRTSHARTHTHNPSGALCEICAKVLSYKFNVHWEKCYTFAYSLCIEFSFVVYVQTNSTPLHCTNVECTMQHACTFVQSDHISVDRKIGKPFRQRICHFLQNHKYRCTNLCVAVAGPECVRVCVSAKLNNWFDYGYFSYPFISSFMVVFSPNMHITCTKQSRRRKYFSSSVAFALFRSFFVFTRSLSLPPLSSSLPISLHRSFFSVVFISCSCEAKHVQHHINVLLNSNRNMT